MKHKKKAVLFDMDGTLVRMNEKEFTDNYFARLCSVICPLGFDADQLVRALWAGVAAMVKNDGSVYNYDRFWNAFSSIMGEQIRAHEQIFEHFYAKGDFCLTREVTKPNPQAKKLIDCLHRNGVRTVLATNPLFPECAQLTRLSWIGLTASDFEWITHYENCKYCKPSQGYYQAILEHTGLAPYECLMIGNSVAEDILPAEALGITTFLVTEYASGDIAKAPNKGSFTDMMAFVMDKTGITSQDV